MSTAPLRYKISSWRQLPQCMSNNSRELHVSVTDFIQNGVLEGLRIQINHDKLGTLFACVLNASGPLLTTSNNLDTEFSPSEILAQLERYGFFVEFDPRSNLTGSQLQYLITLNDLHYDKIRIMDVWSTNNITNTKYCNHQIVAFMASANPNWLDNNYSCSVAEFTEALNNGTAANLTKISETQKYDWSWLSQFVANIADIIRDNAEVE